MTTTPNEPVQDPDVVPSGDPNANPIDPVSPGEDPGGHWANPPRPSGE